MRNRMTLSCLALLCLCGTMVACGPSLPAGMPPLVPCTLVIVDENGSPMDGVTFRLMPDDPNNKWVTAGVSTSDGTAAVKTDGSFPGAPLGTYKVTCSKVESVPTGRKTEDGEDVMAINELLAKEFTSPVTTPLSLDVRKDATKHTIAVGKAK